MIMCGPLCKYLTQIRRTYCIISFISPLCTYAFLPVMSRSLNAPFLDRLDCPLLPDEFHYLNSFMAHGISQVVNMTSPFPILGLLSRIFLSFSKFKGNFCKQTVGNLIRRRILRRLIRFCPVCQSPTKGPYDYMG